MSIGNKNMRLKSAIRKALKGVELTSLQLASRLSETNYHGTNTNQLGNILIRMPDVIKCRTTNVTGKVAVWALDDVVE